MPLWFFPSLMGILATLSLLAGIWLVIHLRDVASLFSSDTSNDIIRGPGRRRASRARTWFVLFAFNAGWIAALLIWIFVIGGHANAVTNAAA